MSEQSFRRVVHLNCIIFSVRLSKEQAVMGLMVDVLENPMDLPTLLYIH